MNWLRKIAVGALALCISITGTTFNPQNNRNITVSAAEPVSMEWGSVEIGGGGFVSGIVTGQKEMYARTDVGGAYRYNYETEEWEQLLAFLNETDRGLLSIDAMAVDPTDDYTIYLLCGCAYFSDARTVVFKSTDGGKTFTQHDVTDMIQVHGNGNGRQCGEAIAVDPDDPNIIYCGGDVAAGDSALIWSQDGGETWEPVTEYAELEFGEGTEKRHYFEYNVNWPKWEDHIVKAATVSTNNDNDYMRQNGVAAIAVRDGKVYVATSVLDIPNVVVADVKTHNFTVLSDKLPTNSYPSRLEFDSDGNLFIPYMDSIGLDKTNGGIYKYEPSTGNVTDISPSGEAYGGISIDPDNTNHIVASTCANSPMSQLWYENAWEDGNVAWGERFFRSTDGGESWEEITPGNAKDWGQPLMADYLQDGGREWIRNKSIHWSGSVALDPRDPNRFFTTSGNGVFVCNDTWGELPQYTFHPDGIEEVVALDMVSVPGGENYSAIGDYDGFIHTDVDVPGKQYQPNMGSTCAIAYCPQNPDVMVRYAESQNETANGFYSLDGGITWTKMNSSTGGKAAITQLEDGTYRFFQSGSSDGNVKYSDDFGETWNNCDGIPSVWGSKTTYMLVEPDKPNVVYAYATYYNSSWVYSKASPDLSDACYKFCVSTDYGKTFTSTDICMYDQCDSAGRIAYLSEDNIILGAGWYGLYNVTDGGKTVTKKDVFYCKTVGYGAPEKEGGINTLYIYGKPAETDPEGIYRSTDGGDTWVCINTDKLYGGTGNGNFLVGDMNEFGTVYMSTVGCGIVYGRLDSSGDDILWGDADLDGEVGISDVVKVMCYASNKDKYPIQPQGIINADVYQNGDGVSALDALSIQKRITQVITSLPES